MQKVDLSQYKNPPDLDKGAGFLKRALWFLVNAWFLQNPANPSSKIKIILLRLFGARIGKGVVIKPGVNIKSPWFLQIGDYCMIGERTWIDSLAPVSIGNSVCISQDVYFCCGNHDWSDPAFGKSVHPIKVEDGVWIATRATILPGVILRSHCVVAACSMINKDTEPYIIYAGTPAVAIRKREISSEPKSKKIE